jgi:hypothetical protein
MVLIVNEMDVLRLVALILCIKLSQKSRNSQILCLAIFSCKILTV